MSTQTRELAEQIVDLVRPEISPERVKAQYGDPLPDNLHPEILNGIRAVGRVREKNVDLVEAFLVRQELLTCTNDEQEGLSFMKHPIVHNKLITFRRIQNEVAAIKLPPEDEDPSDELLEFLAHAEYTSERDAEIRINGRNAGPGDYVLRYPSGVYAAVRAVEFEKEYEPTQP